MSSSMRGGVAGHTPMRAEPHDNAPLIQELEGLITRLEAATGPDSKLDRDLARVCEIPWSSDEDGQYGPYDIMPPRVRFTTSLDAALLLVPKGWDGIIPFGYHIRFPTQIWRGKESSIVVRGPTPAIALCLAALKARAAK